MCRIASGVLPLLFYAWYLTYNLSINEAGNAFWICHFASLLIGTGILFQHHIFISTGFLWLLAGIPLWTMYLFSGGNFTIPSFLTHFGSFFIAFHFQKSNAFSKFSWIAATLGNICLTIAAWLFTNPSLNVNFSHSVWKGWESTFTNHTVYLLAIWFFSAVYFYLMQTLIQFLFKK